MLKLRIQNLLMQMEKDQIDLTVITSTLNVYYLTDFYCDPHERFMALILTKSGKSYLVVPSLEKESAAKAAVDEVIWYTDDQQPFDVLMKSLNIEVESIAVEKNHLSFSRYEMFAALFPTAAFSDAEGWLNRLRARKSPDEIVKMKKAIYIVEQALQAGIDAVKPGVTEKDIAAELEYKMKQFGADRYAFGTLVLTGKQSALPHGKPGLRKIEENAFLLFDLGVYVDGYNSDITRTVVVGEPTQEMVRIYETVREAVELAIEGVRPGVSFASLDRIARDHITSRGYGEYFIHRLGHGLGMDTHEYPSVHAKNEERTEEGMVFTIEPGIYIPEIGGVRIEDDVLVTSTGVEVLTTFPKELMSVPVTTRNLSNGGK